MTEAKPTKKELQAQLDAMKGSDNLTKEEELKLLAELSEKHDLTVQSKAKFKSKKGKIYKSVKCKAGCGHIFRRKWSEHVDKEHDGKDPGFTVRGSQQ